MKTTLRVTGAALIAAGLMWMAPAANAAPASKAPGIHQSDATDVSAQRRYRRVYRAYPRYRYYPRYYGYAPYYNPYYRPYYGPGVYFGAPGFRFGFGF